MEINFALAFVQANEYEGLPMRRKRRRRRRRRERRRKKEAAEWARNFTIG